MRDFSKIVRGFEAYYTLINQGNAALAQAAELLKKIEEEFNTSPSIKKKVTFYNGGTPSELRVNIINMMKSNVNRCWTAGELSQHFNVEHKKVANILTGACATNQIIRKSPGKYSIKAA